MGKKLAQVFALLMLVLCCSAVSLLNKSATNKLTSQQTTNSTGTLLEYTGSAASAIANETIRIRVEIDTSVGIRSEATIESGSALIAHVAFFYKFAKPYQSITYDYRTHKSTINKIDNQVVDSKVDVIGKETLDGYYCTHLQHGGGTNNVSDYWMSTMIPGFWQTVTVLNHINPGIFLGINWTIFNWGGLIRMTIVGTYPQVGTGTVNLRLKEADTGVSFPSTDFNVPSK